MMALGILKSVKGLNMRFTRTITRLNKKVGCKPMCNFSTKKMRNFEMRRAVIDLSLFYDQLQWHLINGQSLGVDLHELGMPAGLHWLLASPSAQKSLSYVGHNLN